MLPPDVRFKGKNAPKSISVGALPQTPLKELTGKGREEEGAKVGEGRGEKGRGEEERGGRGSSPPCVGVGLPND